MNQPRERQTAWRAGSFTFDDVRVRLGAGELAELSHACAEGAERDLDRVTASTSGVARVIERACAERVDGWPGCAIFTGLSSLPPDRWRSAFRVMSRLVGEISPQDASGLEVREVKDRGTRIGEGERARYSDSRFGGSLHTDGAQSPLPVPDYFALFCMRRALSGGAFRVVCLRTVLERLEQRAGGAPETLRGPFHFDRRGERDAAGRRTALKPILFILRGEPAITYLREYVDQGHAQEGAPPLTPAQRAALDALDSVLDVQDLAVEGCLEPGELLIVDNTRLLHGRTTFTDAEELDRKRVMLRVWLRRRE